MLTLGSLAPVGATQAGQQEDLELLRKRIFAMQQKLEDATESKSEAADSLRASERAISNSKRNLSLLAEQLRSADRALNELQSQQRELEQTMASQQSLLEELLRQQYLAGRHDYLMLLLSNRPPHQIARNLHYYQYIARDRAARLDALRDHLAKLDVNRRAMSEQRAILAALRSEQSAQQKILEKEQRSRKQTLSKIASKIHSQRREINRLQRDENRLAQLIDNLSKILTKPKSGSLIRNESLPDSSFDNTPFEQLKGKLSLPVIGLVTNRFGTPRPESNILWKGLFLRTSSGQPVKAIAAGQVVFADWLRGFGNLMILDHGKGYMSLYANNETLYKQVGDTLSGGDTIAAAGNSGGNEESGLYFELRHESKPLDPLKWVAAKSLF